MSHHGLQVLYSLMNAADWACERAFTPLPDFEDGAQAAWVAALQPRDLHAACAGSMSWAFRSSTRSATRTC